MAADSLGIVEFEDSQQKSGQVITHWGRKIAFAKRPVQPMAGERYHVTGIEEHKRFCVLTLGVKLPIYLAIVNKMPARYEGTGKWLYLPDIYKNTLEDGLYEVNHLEKDKYGSLFAFPGKKLAPSFSQCRFLKSGHTSLYVGRGSEAITYTLVNDSAVENMMGFQWRDMFQYRCEFYDEVKYAFAVEKTGVKYLQWSIEQERKKYHGRTITQVSSFVLTNRDEYTILYNDVTFYPPNARAFRSEHILIERFGLLDAITDEQLRDVFKRADEFFRSRPRDVGSDKDPDESVLNWIGRDATEY